MAARVLHTPNLTVEDRSDKLDLRTDFATGQLVRILTRPERDRRAAAFKIVCEKRGAMARVAEAWNKSHQFVGKVRDNELALTDDRIRALPRAQRLHLFEVLDETSQLSLPLF